MPSSSPSTRRAAVGGARYASIQSGRTAQHFGLKPPAPLFLPPQVDSASDRKYEGAGLGLAVGRKIAEAGGGSLACTSEGLGRGACFTLLVPLKPPRRVGDKRGSAHSLASTFRLPTGTRRVSVADASRRASVAEAKRRSLESARQGSESASKDGEAAAGGADDAPARANLRSASLSQELKRVEAELDDEEWEDQVLESSYSVATFGAGTLAGGNSGGGKTDVPWITTGGTDMTVRGETRIFAELLCCAGSGSAWVGSLSACLASVHCNAAGSSFTQGLDTTLIISPSSRYYCLRSFVLSAQAYSPDGLIRSGAKKAESVGSHSGGGMRNSRLGLFSLPRVCVNQVASAASAGDLAAGGGAGSPGRAAAASAYDVSPPAAPTSTFFGSAPQARHFARHASSVNGSAPPASPTAAVSSFRAGEPAQAKPASPAEPPAALDTSSASAKLGVSSACVSGVVLAPASLAVEGPSCAGKSVLVAEDDRTNGILITRILRKFGFQKAREEHVTLDCCESWEPLRARRLVGWCRVLCFAA